MNRLCYLQPFCFKVTNKKKVIVLYLRQLLLGFSLVCDTKYFAAQLCGTEREYGNLNIDKMLFSLHFQTLEFSSISCISVSAWRSISEEISCTVNTWSAHIGSSEVPVTLIHHCVIVDEMAGGVGGISHTLRPDLLSLRKQHFPFSERWEEGD